MATLTGQSIASSYEQLLHVDRDGGGNTTNLVDVKDGDNGTTFALKLATDKISVVGDDNVSIIIDSTTATRNGILSFTNSADNKNFEIKHNSFDPEAGTNQLEINSTDTANIMVFNLDGKIGLGTANPSTLLNLESATSTAITAENTGNAAVALNLDANRSGADQGLGNINFKWNGTAVAQISGASGADTTNKDDGQIQFSTMSGGSSSVNMVLDKDGKLGIGDTTPNAPITAVFTDNSTNAADNSALTHASGIYLQNESTTNESYAGIGFRSNNFDGSLAFVYEGSDNTGRFSLNMEGSERLVVKSTGKVGIGDDNPDRNLGVKASNASIAIEDTGGGFSELYFADATDSSGYFSYAHGTDILTFGIGGGNRFKLDANSRISLSNNDTSGTGGGDSTSGNTILGYLAGNALVGSSNTGYQSVIIGHRAGEAVTTGDNNLIIGNQTGKTITTSGSNVFLGTHAGGSIPAGQTTTDGTVAIGYFAGNQISGEKNVAIGFEAQMSQTTGNRNTVIGHSAMRTADGGEDFNTIIGSEAGYYINNDASHDNVIIGMNALQGGIGTILGNIAIGSRAMDAVSNNNQTGTIAIGTDALGALTSGGENMAIGYQAMGSMTTGAANIAIGYQTMDGLNHADADANIAIGNGALGGAAAVGLHSCVAIGHNALDAASMTDGANGTVAIGRDALGALTSGQGNTAIGYQAMDANTTGNQNTAVGYGAAGSIPGGALGNTAIGYNALANGNNEATDENTCIGHLAGDLITSGENNVIIGAGADVGTNTDSNSIVIGREAIGQGSNKIVLGNSAHTDVYMSQDSGATVHCAGIDFSATQPAPDAGSSSSEVLDSYEEGTWTPVLNGATNGAAANYDTQFGAYTKIGRMVHVTCHIAMTNFNNSGGAAISGNLTITGLPFTSNNTNAAYTNGIVRYGDFALPTSTDNSATVAPTVFASTNKNSASISLALYDNSSGSTSLQASEVSSDGDILFDVTYFV